LNITISNVERNAHGLRLSHKDEKAEAAEWVSKPQLHHPVGRSNNINIQMKKYLPWRSLERREKEKTRDILYSL
jgi:hypothetical protein